MKDWPGYLSLNEEVEQDDQEEGQDADGHHRHLGDCSPPLLLTGVFLAEQDPPLLPELVQAVLRGLVEPAVNLHQAVLLHAELFDVKFKIINAVKLGGDVGEVCVRQIFQSTVSSGVVLGGLI